MMEKNKRRFDENNGENKSTSANTSRRNVLSSILCGAAFIGTGSMARADDAETDVVVPCGDANAQCGGGGGGYPQLIVSHVDSDSTPEYETDNTMEQYDKSYVYEAVSPFNDYWDIPIETVTNVYNYINGTNELNRAIEKSQITMSTDNNAYADNSKQYVGACTNEDPRTEEYDWAESVMSLAIGQLPAPGYLQDAAEIIGALALDWLDRYDDTNYRRKFDWIHDEHNSRVPSREQVIFWNRVTAKGLSPGESATFDIDSWTYADRTVDRGNPEVNMWVQNEYSITVEAPSFSPSDALAMSNQERENLGINLANPNKLNRYQKTLTSKNSTSKENGLIKAPVKITSSKV